MRWVKPTTEVTDLSNGKRLVKEMSEQGISKAELSRRSGVSEKTIQNLRTGRSKGNMGTWFLIAKVLGMDMNELVRCEDER